MDPAWLWLWYRPVAAALIHPLAWKRPYAAGAALKQKKNILLDEREKLVWAKTEIIPGLNIQNTIKNGTT